MKEKVKNLNGLNITYKPQAKTIVIASRFLHNPLPIQPALFVKKVRAFFYFFTRTSHFLNSCLHFLLFLSFFIFLLTVPPPLIIHRPL